MHDLQEIVEHRQLDAGLVWQPAACTVLASRQANIALVQAIG